MDYSVSVLQFAEARASEIASLMDEVKSSKKSKHKAWFQHLPHHMRRRGASQNPKRVPKNLRGSNKTPTAKASSKSKKHKRQPKNKQAEYAQRSTPDSTWLENHIWHAKRFKMETLWGYRLPIHSNDRKLGSSHDSAANRAMLQDLSYYCCIELTGLQERLISQLSVLADASSGHTFASEMFLDGAKEGYSFLYHPKNCPYKAIGPISFLWKPVLDISNDKKCEHTFQIPGDSNRKLWVWCHPSIHDELVQVLIDIFNFKEETPLNICSDKIAMEIDEVEEQLKESNQVTFACKLNFAKTEQYFCKERVYSSNGVKMVLRKNTLVRHRLIGPLSQSILTQVLKLANVIDSSHFIKISDNGNSTKRFKADTESNLSEQSNIVDPLPLKQLWWESYYKSEPMKSCHAKKEKLLSYLKDEQSAHYVTPRSVIGLTVRDPRMQSGLKNDENGFVEESFNNYMNLDELLTPEVADSALWDESIRNEVTATKMSDREINEERSKCISAIDLGRKENRVPIIIIHQCSLNGFGSGWDLIAPRGWSSEFWRSLERKGGRPAGLRDIHFINLETGRPSFPCSFPDAAAGSAYEEKLRIDGLKEFYRHPKSKRPNFCILGVSTPFFMCWKTLVHDWEKELGKPEIAALFPSVENLTACTNPSNETNGIMCAGDKEKQFCVFRKAEIRQLSNLCQRLNKTPRYGSSKEKVDMLRETYFAFVTSLNSQIQFSKSVILIKIRCLNKGRPSKHAGLYLLSDLDIQESKNKSQFSGPTEPCHSSNKNTKVESKSLERPQIQSLISCSSRKIIGYVSEGGFSSLCGQGYAIGHCTAVGFLVLLKQCLEAQSRPLVLVREQCSFKYRVATVEVIENYL